MSKTDKKMNMSAGDFTALISRAIQVPGVKVDREAFLQNQFKDESIERQHEIVDLGPVAAGVSRAEILRKAEQVMKDRTLLSTAASFAAGLPGGLTMAATIPADLVQFFAIALRASQEIAYLYGEGDFWDGGMPDDKRIQNQLLLYCGVMFGVSGAASTVRVVTSRLAVTAAKRLPQKALTQGVVYPVVKSIARALSVQMTKGVFAKGVSKAIPIAGGVISGGITYMTMRPMGTRLIKTLDEAHFSYDEPSYNQDMDTIEAIAIEEESKESE